MAQGRVPSPIILQSFGGKKIQIKKKYSKLFRFLFRKMRV